MIYQIYFFKFKKNRKIKLLKLVEVKVGKTNILAQYLNFKFDKSFHIYQKLDI